MNFGWRGERGMAMIAVLTVILVLVVLSGLVLHLTGKEIALTAFRLGGAQSMYQAEAGAVAGRAALLALMNADPIGVTGVDPTLNGVALANWFAAGDAAAQNAFRLFDYLVTDGQRYTLNATPATGAVTFYVDWGLGTPHRKLVAAGPAPQNALGPGNYAATVVIVRRRAPHASCVPGPDCYVHRLGADEYEYFYTYTITSDGQVPPRARRRITFSRDFSVRVRRQTFAQFALFTHVHLTPPGSPIWFTSRTSFDGPVHTNREYPFPFFPNFSPPVPLPPPGSPIWSPSRTSFDGPVHTNGEYRFAFFPKFSDRLTSVSGTAWFNNNGGPVRLAGNENVVAAVRRDAPVVFDGTPTNYADDNDNPPANFTRGVASIPMPTNPFSQQGVSIGRDPAD